MPGTTLTIGHLFVIRWQTIAVGDISTVLREVRALRAKTGRPVIYVAIQDDDYREPSPEAKEELKREFPELLKHVTNDYLVITATGVRASLQRSFLKALLTAGRIAGVPGVDRVVILSTFTEVLAREAKNLPLPASMILRELREKGFLHNPTFAAVP